MNRYSLLILPFLIFGLIQTSDAQIKIDYTPLPYQEKTTPVKGNSEMNDLFNKMFPGITLRWRTNAIIMGDRLGCLEGVSGDTSYLLPERLNYMLFDLEIINNHKRTYSDEQLLKTSVYLLFLNNSSQNVLYIPSEIEIQKINFTYPFDDKDFFSPDLREFNYRVTAFFSDEYLLKKAEIYYRVIDKEVISFYGNIEFKDGTKFKINFGPWETIQSLSKRDLDNYIKKRKNIKDKKSIDGALYWERVDPVDFPAGNVQIVNKSSADYFYMTTRYNNTYPQFTTKFKITGIDPGYSNLYLKIFTCSEFGPKIELFSSKIVEISNGVGKTQGFFTPLNNENDGFCQFEIWNGTVFLANITKCFLVLNKIKHGSFPASGGQMYDIHYAYRNFYPRSDIVNTCNTYLTYVENYLNSAWVDQVNTWNLCQGLPGGVPVNSGTSYLISVNPFQDYNQRKFIYWNNDNYYDCFHDWLSARSIGITAYPQAFITFNGYTYNYIESDFVDIEISHEFFHGIQYSLAQLSSPTPFISQMRWLIDGQARFIQTVANENAEYSYAGLYKQDATKFLNNLKISLNSLSYDYCMFWRFLFENYSSSGSTADKLEIIRETNKGYNSYSIPDIENHMDSKLNAAAYNNMDDAVKEFSKRVYFNNYLQSNWNPNPIGFYPTPHVEKTIVYNGSNIIETGSIPSSWGIDYYQIQFQTDGNVFISFNELSTDLDYYANLIFLDNPGNDNIIPLYQCQGSKKFTIPASNTNAVLIVVRLDNKEATEISSYSICIDPEVPPEILKADFKCQDNTPSTTFEINTPIDFFDLSNPGGSAITSYSWSFPGASISSSNIKDPQNIIYTSPGNYSVSLTVQNATDQNKKEKVNYITIYDPGSGTNLLDFSGYGPWAGNVNQSIGFTISIITGTPPYDISFYFGDGSSVILNDQYEPYYNVYHSYTQPQEYLITYIVNDANHIPVTKTDFINIGTPGSHSVDFSYIPSEPGITSQVDFIDETHGGFKPYYSWQWIFGNEILTDAQPNPPWTTIVNSYINPDPNLSGNTGPVQFPVYGTYPVTLIVTDNQGFNIETTRLIQVKTAIKCLQLDDSWLDPLPNKHHVYKIPLEQKCLCYWDYWEYYKSDIQWCHDNIGYELANCNNCAITDAIWSFKDFNNTLVNYFNPSMIVGTYTYWYNWWAGGTPNPHCFMVNPVQKGKHQLILEAWNRISDQQRTPATKGDYHMYDAIVRDIIVVDKNENLDVEQDIPPGIHETEYTGTVTFAQTNAVNVNAGATIAYEAHSSLLLNPGFTALAGSSFRATVDPVVFQKNSCNETSSNTETKSNIDTAGFIIYPNPNSGTFHIKGTPESNTIARITVFNEIGYNCDSYISINRNEAYVSINNVIPGMYVLKIVNNKNQDFFRKIVIVK